MAVDQEFRFSSADGSADLYGCMWLPAEQPTAVLQLVHGISEYVGRYDHLARYFTAHGFVVVGEDHLGHGKTPLDTADLGFTAERDGWAKMTDNVHALMLRTRNQYPGLPYVLLGHSMGSFLARSYLIRYPSTVDACLLMGTGQQSSAVLAAALLVCAEEKKRLGGRAHSALMQSLAFGAYNNQFKPIRTASDWVCSNEDVVDRYVADPLCQVKASITLMQDMMTGISFNQKKSNLAKMDRNTPVFFLSGALDPVGNNGKGVTRAFRSFVDSGCTQVKMKLYPDCRHEIHNESIQNEVFADMLTWIDSKIKR